MFDAAAEVCLPPETAGLLKKYVGAVSKSQAMWMVLMLAPSDDAMRMAMQASKELLELDKQLAPLLQKAGVL